MKSDSGSRMQKLFLIVNEEILETDKNVDVEDYDVKDSKISHSDEQYDITYYKQVNSEQI